MMEVLVTSTNRKIDQVLEKLPDDVRTDDRKTHFRTTDDCETYTLLGLVKWSAGVEQ